MFIYAANYLRDQGKTNKEIAKELGTTTKAVADALTKSNSKTKETIKTTSSKVNSKDLMITKTEAKKINSVAIMTRAASEVNDAFKKNVITTESRTSKNAIHRPKK